MIQHMSIEGLDTFTKIAFSLIADRFRTTKSRRISNAVSTSASFPLQIWVTRAPITSYTEKNNKKYGKTILKVFKCEVIPISTWLKPQPTPSHYLILLSSPH